MGARLPYAHAHAEVEPPLNRAMCPHSPCKFQLLSGGSPARSAGRPTRTPFITPATQLRHRTTQHPSCYDPGPRDQTGSSNGHKPLVPTQHGVDHRLRTSAARPHPVTSKGTTRRLDHGPTQLHDHGHDHDWHDRDRARSPQPQGPETALSAPASESQLRDRLEFHFSTVVVQPVVCRICLAG